jgi:hypothetical protein
MIAGRLAGGPIASRAAYPVAVLHVRLDFARLPRMRGPMLPARRRIPTLTYKGC